MIRAVFACVIMTFIAALNTPAHAESANEGVAQEGSIYHYDENDVPEVFFFPPDQARWNGYRVTMREWYLLSDLQKERFVSEYIGELKRHYLSALDAVGMDYLEALNAFPSIRTKRRLRSRRRGL
jgi:hypothetical protein